MSESDSELEEMKESMPFGSRLTKPLSTAVLRLLNYLEGEKGYFEYGTDRRDENRPEKVRLYFHVAFYSRLKLYFPISVIILSLAVIDTCRLEMLPLQGYGLILDGMGAIIIAVGLFRGINGIVRDTPRTSTGMTFGGNTYFNPEPLSATVRNTIDGMFGCSLLTLGFTVQLIAISKFNFGIC